MKRHFLRSRCASNAEWKASGVLPFAFNHKQECYVLLGSEVTRTGPKGKLGAIMWSDFGGKREAADLDSIETASREFAEETLGVFGGVSVDSAAVERSAAAMATRLREGSRSLCSIHQLKKGAYHMYTCMVTFVDPIFFELAAQQNDNLTLPALPAPAAYSSFQQQATEGLDLEHNQKQQQPFVKSRRKPAAGKVVGAEKKSFVWVALDELLKAVQVPRGTYFFHSSQRIAPGQFNHWGSHTGLQIHPCFASSLRIAKATGLLEVVEACRSRPLPLPPPPTLTLNSRPGHGTAAAAGRNGAQQGSARANREGESLTSSALLPAPGCNAARRGDHAGAERAVGQESESARQQQGEKERRRWQRANSSASGPQLDGNAAQPQSRRIRQRLDLAEAAGMAAHHWALHRHHQQQQQQPQQQVPEAQQEQVQHHQQRLDVQAESSCQGGIDAKEKIAGGGGGRAMRAQAAKGGLQPCHMLFWLLQGNVCEQLGIDLPEGAHKLMHS